MSTDTALLTDDVLVGDLRDECERWATRDELEAGFARLFALRDKARASGLPLPASCPRHTIRRASAAWVCGRASGQSTDAP